MIYYNQIKLQGKRVGRCSCGKRIVNQKTFSQTENPFNLKNGRIKTHSEIIQELDAELQDWQKKSSHCPVPTYWEWSAYQRQQYDTTGHVTLIATCGSEVICDKG